MFALRREVVKIVCQARCVHTNDSLVDNISNVTNRNPRNVELLRIQAKPHGYTLEDKQEFWHKLTVINNKRYLTAEVVHYENGVVLTASTKESGIKNQLYSLTDTAAYMNLGKVIALRCLESGIYHLYCDLNPENGEKIKLFRESAIEIGLQLNEPKMYRNVLPQSRKRYQKPWEVYD